MLLLEELQLFQQNFIFVLKILFNLTYVMFQNLFVYVVLKFRDLRTLIRCVLCAKRRGGLDLLQHFKTNSEILLERKDTVRKLFEIR